MINFKALALATTLAASALVGGSAAKAEIVCGQLGDSGRWCGEYVGQYQGGNAYEITYSHFDGKEDMTVVCNRRNVINWSSNGTLRQDQAEWVAAEFCALPG